MSFHSIQTINSARIARFGAGATILRAAAPLDDDQIRRAVPSVFADDKHGSRSDRYTYIPTSAVLAGCSPDVAGLLRLKARAPMRPGKPQQPCDVGLFSDDADQLDLCEMFQDQPED